MRQYFKCKLTTSFKGERARLEPNENALIQKVPAFLFRTGTKKNMDPLGQTRPILNGNDGYLLQCTSNDIYYLQYLTRHMTSLTYISLMQHIPMSYWSTLYKHVHIYYLIYTIP